MFVAVAAFLVFSIVLCLLLANLVRIRLGPPPIQRLHIGYKYVYKGKTTASTVFDELSYYFPGRKLIKFCYAGSKSTQAEFAHGVIFNDKGSTLGSVDDMALLLKMGYSLVATPTISHSLYAVYPVLPWVPLTRWIAVLIGYPKLSDYVQRHNLCAYPVLEIYSTFTLTMVIPLNRQDEFVVKEAERLVYGRKYSAMLRPPSQEVLHSVLTPKLTKSQMDKLSKTPRATKG